MDGLLVRFGPSEYENVDGELAKIWQTTIVLEYQSHFKHLSNRAWDWIEHQLIGTFIEGLRLDIRCEVKANKPLTMMAAISFARLQEITKKAIALRSHQVLDSRRHYASTHQLFSVILM